MTTQDRSKIVVIKKYVVASDAYVDGTLLGEAGIDYAIEGETGSTMLPYIQNQVWLAVNAHDVQRALQIVPGSSVEEEK